VLHIVQRACGNSASDVQAIFTSPTELQIRLRTRTKADADRLGPLLANHPELIQYSPKVSITVPQ
jgi:hypothetical protein